MAQQIRRSAAERKGLCFMQKKITDENDTLYSEF